MRKILHLTEEERSLVLRPAHEPREDSDGFYVCDECTDSVYDVKGYFDEAWLCEWCFRDRAVLAARGEGG